MTTNNDIIKITPKAGRNQLLEGRTYGVAFAFLKKLKTKNSYKMVQPLSPCKDYLAEPVFTENTGIWSRAYGLSYTKKLDIFTKKFAYLVMKVLKTENGSYPSSKYSYIDDCNILDENYKMIETNINKMEKHLELKNLTEIIPCVIKDKGHNDNDRDDNNAYLIKVPIEWCQNVPTISLYTLLIRSLMRADEEVDITKYHEQYKHSDGDRNLLHMCKDKIQKIYNEKKLPINQHSFDSIPAIPHNYGIVNGWNGEYNNEKPLTNNK